MHQFSSASSASKPRKRNSSKSLRGLAHDDEPRLNHKPCPGTCRCTTTGVTTPGTDRRRCMITPTTTSHAVKRLEDLPVSKTDTAAIGPQPPARQVAILHLPACLSRAAVPIVRPLTSEDHDPLKETGTELRSRRG